jgi:nucleotide-binding universal stress UspA family protein
MIRKILYPTDFSEHSQKCLDYILHLKDCGIKEVILMHVVDEKIIRESDFVFEGELDEESVSKRSLRNSRSKLEKLASPLVEAGIKVDYVTVTGNPCAEIIREEFDSDVSLIIMGYRGHNLAEELLLGSTSEKVLRKSKKPVLLVR